MELSSLLAGCFVTVVCFVSLAKGDDAEEIRQLIPAATAMTKSDFDALATSPTAPKESDFADKSFALKIFAMKMNDQRTEAQLDEFKFLGEVIPKPSRLAEEIHRTIGSGRLRITIAPVTFVHANRITDFTCEVEGDNATGVVTFQVPELYEGKVNYVAKRKEEAWQITELTMPNHAIHLLRGEDGKWVEKK